MINIARNGTKINWTLSGMTRLRNLLQASPRTAAISSGGNTCEL